MKIILFLILLSSWYCVEGRIQVCQTGSSSVYPFAMKVAQEFFKKTKHLAPLIESTSTGRGFVDFCLENDFWCDVISASRPIKDQELEQCKGRSRVPILEICIGLDGIAVAVKKSSKGFESLRLQDLFKAIVKKIKDNDGVLVDNPYKKWSEINPKLPNIPIRILIPSKAHGTRDAFEHLVLGGEHEIRDSQEVREITDYESADSHNLLFEFLERNSGTLAFVGMNLLSNHTSVKPLPINAIEPTFINMQQQRYPLVRKLFIYLRKENYRRVDSLKPYINEWLSADASGEEGYLTKMGLIPLSRSSQRQRIL